MRQSLLDAITADLCRLRRNCTIIEALEGMVDNDVLGADCREAVAAEVADALRKPRRVWWEQQVGPVVHDQLLKVDNALKPALQEHLPRLGFGLDRDKHLQVLGHVRIAGEVDNLTATPPLEHRFV
jgi:hypothetical protein